MPDLNHFDVAIVGAGINGASAAQHLSAAGYRVIIVDQGDFASGATSRSSRLLHCGLRHLATGANFWRTLARPSRLVTAMRTVRADMLARDEIVRTIPGRLKRINFCLPVYSDDRFSPWQLDAAFAAMRLTSPGGVPLDFRRYSGSDIDSVPIAPWLRDRERLRGVAVFREYLFDWPERIALDALFDARRMGAVVRNYTRVVDLRRRQDGRWYMTLQPAAKAQPSGNHLTEVTADMVLNLAGAGVDGVSASAGSNAAPKCRAMKGIHIALRLPDEFADWGVFAFNSIGEPLYCLPFRGIHYAGLTRTPFEGYNASVSATDNEIDWMINELNRCLPKLEATRDDILYTWAGVNPLTFDPAQPHGSREIKLHDLASDGLPNMLTLTGGPVMTHRRVARKLTSIVGARLSPSRQPQALSFDFASAMSDQTETQASVTNACPQKAEIVRCAREEMPVELADLLMRRLGVGWDPDQGTSQARAIAEIAAPEMGWSEADIEDQLADYQNHLAAARRLPQA